MSGEESPLILVIDDDRAGRMLLRSLLGREGYRLEFADDGLSGLERARQLQPDLILLDVLMPGIDGFEVCRRLRQDRLLAQVPVVMLTALEDSASRLAGIEAGADDFVSKPFQAEELRARVRTVTRLNRYRRIRTERARFDWVVEHAQDGYLLVDRQGRLLYANARLRSWLGLAAEATGSDMAAAILEQFQPQPAEAWEGWPQLQGNFQLFRPECDRAPATWLAVSALRHQLGDDEEVLLQLRDISQELSAQRSCWSFEALISHKLRTPLTKIGFGLSFLARKADRLSVDKIKELAETSQAGVEELRRELEGILSYLNTPSARPSGPGLSLNRLHIMLTSVAEELEIPQPQWLSSEAGDLTLYLGERAAYLVIWELLQNSKKFHPQQSPQVTLRGRRLGQEVELSFQDDGRRLPPDHLERAFLPYFQGETYFTGQQPGLGLGLTMVQSLLWEVGGRCTLANRPEREGVVVTLTLPCQPEACPSGR